MRKRMARFLVRLYPRRWRDRYGDELLVLIGEHGLDARRTANIIRAAGDEWATLAVRRLLGSEREDAVIGKIARWVVRVVLAWAAAMTVSAVFPVAATVVGVAAGICGWDAVWRQVEFFGFQPYGILWAPMFFPAVLVLTAPAVIAFKLTRAGSEWPWTARVVTVLALLVAGLLWRAWWDSYSPILSLPTLHMCLSLAAGGSVIACALFPRSAQAPSSGPPRLAPA